MMRPVFKIALSLAFVCGAAAEASAGGIFRHNSLLRHYGPRGVYPAHFYDYYAPPTRYGHWGLTAYQGWGVGFNQYPYPYRAYYGGYGYGPYKNAEGRPLFNNYGYAYPPQTRNEPPSQVEPAMESAPPATQSPSAQPNP